MEINLKEEFNIIEEGTKYGLPVYDVVEDQGIVKVEDTGTENDPFQNQIISFVRGSKLGDENVEKKRGTLHEHLLSMMIHDLKFKSSIVPSRESSIVITKLQEALMWLRQRQVDRVKREVEGTYKK